MAVATVVIAYFAWSQNKLNKTQMKIALYNRRRKVLDSIYRFMAETHEQMNTDNEKIELLRSETMESIFIFDEEIENYIQLLFEKSRQLMIINEDIEKNPEKYDSLKLDKNEISKWFNVQFSKLKGMFEKYLKL